MPDKDVVFTAHWTIEPPVTGDNMNLIALTALNVLATVSVALILLLKKRKVE